MYRAALSSQVGRKSRGFLLPTCNYSPILPSSSSPSDRSSGRFLPDPTSRQSLFAPNMSIPRNGRLLNAWRDQEDGDDDRFALVYPIIPGLGINVPSGMRYLIPRAHHCLNFHGKVADLSCFVLAFVTYLPQSTRARAIPMATPTRTPAFSLAAVPPSQSPWPRSQLGSPSRSPPFRRRWRRSNGP